MRKPKTKRAKKQKPKSNDDALEAAIAIAAGAALVAVFGGLAVAYGWKAVVAGAPL
jgi:hypothetical protein